MQSVDYGFSTSVKRSGHAACWCAALGGIVQFGGWPPSEQLSEVVRHEGSNCPLFYMPVTTIARHLHRADQRRSADNFETALAPHRQNRLRTLLGRGPSATKPAAVANMIERGVAVGGSADSGAVPTAALSPTHSTLSVTTEEASERGFVYDEGYVTDAEESEEDSYSDSSEDSTESSRRSTRATAAAAEAPPPLPPPTSSLDSPAASADMVASTITVELLRQVAEETQDRATYGAAAATQGGDAGATSTTASHGRTSVSRSTLTGPSASTLRKFGKSGHPAVDREAPPLRRDTHEVLGKYTVRPLRWQAIRPHVAPRTRHGHHLVSCGERIYVVGGSYWAHGNALASTDMMYDVHTRVWQQVSSLFPPRFCAALARSNAVPKVKWMPATGATGLNPHTTPPASTTSPDPSDLSSPGEGMASEPTVHDDQVLYYFGGLNYSRQLTSTLYRLWLPQETLEELPQYGAVPREQFKGILVCDMQQECNPAKRKRGERSLGRLFYLDGLQDGRPMAPYLRVYNVATGVWVRVCPSPDLVRSQVSLLHYESVEDTADAGAAHATRLRRFEVVGGMPSRRGKQRRSRMCYSFDAVQQRFDYSNALPVPGLTAHCAIPLPDVPQTDQWTDATAGTSLSPLLLADGVTTATAYRAALTVLRDRYGVWSLCCGGNEDWDEAEQNSLGVPVGWLYLFSPRAIPLSEVARVQMECLRMPMVVLGAQKDELLDELF